MGWTRASAPYRSAVTWNTNPPIMLAMPRSQTGRRARRKISRTSNPPVVCTLLAPWRWAIEAVAVQKLAATASKTASCIIALPQPGELLSTGCLIRLEQLRSLCHSPHSVPPAWVPAGVFRPGFQASG
jgi:hypothetical protein